jgi:hypothetical protein
VCPPIRRMTATPGAKLPDSPPKVSVNGQSVEQHPLKDQIDADRYLASKAAERKPGLGIKFAKIVPPGSV